MVMPKKLQIASTTLPTIAGNASTAFPASLLSASASQFNHLFKTPSSLVGEPPPPPPPPPPLLPPQKAPVMASTIVDMVTEMAVSIEKIVIPCSRNK